MTPSKIFFFDEEGATAIEYALICALLVLAVAAILPLVGVSLRGLFQQVQNAFSAS